MVKINPNIKIKTFKDLIAWQKSYRLCLEIYNIAKLFPRSEQFSLTSQIKRSALSIPSNIAEGFTRHQTREYIRFLYIGYSSLAELETQLLVAQDLKYIDGQTFNKIITLHKEVQRIMSALICSLKKNCFKDF